MWKNYSFLKNFSFDHITKQTGPDIRRIIYSPAATRSLTTTEDRLQGQSWGAWDGMRVDSGGWLSCSSTSIPYEIFVVFGWNDLVSRQSAVRCNHPEADYPESLNRRSHEAASVLWMPLHGSTVAWIQQTLSQPASVWTKDSWVLEQNKLNSALTQLNKWLGLD